MSDAFHCVGRFSDAELKRMKKAVEDGELYLSEIAKRFKCSRHTVVRLIGEHGWKNTRTGRTPKERGHDERGDGSQKG